jgi:predicted transcriptional regulator of viral defense system
MAAEVLGLTRQEAARRLARWAAQGWLQRVRRGIYVPVPLESERADLLPEDAWVIAGAAFAPCFISGWSAAGHWALGGPRFHPSRFIGRLFLQPR